METKGLRKKLFPTRRKRRGTKKKVLMLFSSPKKTPRITEHQIISSSVIYFHNHHPVPAYSPLSLPPSHVQPPRGSPLVRHWNTLSPANGAILGVGIEGGGRRERRRKAQKRGKRRELGGLNKETAIIISNIILRLGVSWGHRMSPLKYKVGEYQPAVLWAFHY